MKEIFSKKNIKIIWYLVSLAIFLILLWNWRSASIINTDEAGIIYVCDNIWHGHAQFRCSFLSPSMLAGMLGYVLCGIGANMVTLYIYLPMAFLVALTLWMSADKVEDIWRLLVIDAFYFILIFIYTGHSSSILEMRQHPNASIYCLLACLLYAIITKKQGKMRYIIWTLIWLLGMLSQDALLYIEATAPFFCLLVMRIYTSRRDSKKKRNYIYLFLGLIFGSVAGWIINHIVLFIYPESALVGNYSNWYLVDVDGICCNMRNFVTILLRIFDANAFGYGVFRPWSIVSYIKVFLVAIAFFMAIKEVVALFRNKECDDILAAMGMIIIFLWLALVLTSVSNADSGIRYIVILNYIVPIILGRWVQRWDLRKLDLSIPLHYLERGIAVFASLVCSVSLFTRTGMQTTQYGFNKYQKLAQFLMEHNLEYGYGDFWTCATTTAYARGKSRLLGIDYNSDKGHFVYPITPAYEWILDDDTVFDYIVLANNATTISEEDVINVCGEPKNMYEIDEFKIYVYDYNLKCFF